MVTRTPSLHSSVAPSVSLAAPAIPEDLLTTDDIARLVGVASKARRALRGVPSPSVGAADGELPRQDGDADGESHLADGDSRRKNAADAADGDFPNSKIIAGSALAFYVNQNRRVAAEVVEGDPSGPALVDLVEARAVARHGRAVALGHLRRCRETGPRPPKKSTSPFRQAQAFGAGTRIDRRRGRLPATNQPPPPPPNPPLVNKRLNPEP